MRARVLALVVVFALFAQADAVPSFRAGAQGGLIVMDFIGPVPGMGGHMDIGFAIGQYGSIDYYPSVDFWIKGEDDYRGYEKWRWMEWGFNIADVRYYPPVPLRYIVQPYVGLGPMLVMQMTARHPYNNGDTDQSTGLELGANFIGGCDFVLPAGPRVFVEMRGKSDGYDAFKLYGGVSFPLGS